MNYMHLGEVIDTPIYYIKFTWYLYQMENRTCCARVREGHACIHTLDANTELYLVLN